MTAVRGELDLELGLAFRVSEESWVGHGISFIEPAVCTQCGKGVYRTDFEMRELWDWISV